MSDPPAAAESISASAIFAGCRGTRWPLAASVSDSHAAETSIQGDQT
eukprot:COSAG01_NODE_1084_length_11806_cov_6.349078_7_plen_47_part_00